jgi:hypothetical protein
MNYRLEWKVSPTLTGRSDVVESEEYAWRLADAIRSRFGKETVCEVVKTSEPLSQLAAVRREGTFARWWNGLDANQRSEIIVRIPSCGPEQAEVFSHRLWYELHGWMRDHLRIRFAAGFGDSCPSESRLCNSF